jgi:predicted ferric reductase
MVESIYGFAALFILSLATALVVHLLVRKSLRDLLDNTVKLPSGTTFYARILVIGLYLIALAAAVQTNFNLKEGSALMEYVWKVGDGLASAFGNICLFIAGYLLLITILVAVLRRKRG